MAVPIFARGPYLIATVKSALNDQALVDLSEALVDGVGRFQSRGVIVDVTALDVMDSFAARTLRQLAHMAGQRGAHTVIAGIQPEVAFAMLQLGLSLEGIATVADLEEALVSLDRLGPGRRHSAN